jgi:putative ABC transport system permease protein
VMGRLAPGATREQARLEVNAILAGIAQARGSGSAPVARVEQATGFGFPLAARPAAAVLFGLIGLVMCVAVANVAGLMLARAPARRPEISLRLALGASPGRIIRLILVESLMLGVVGSTVGAALAAVLMHVMPGLAVQLPEHLNYAVDVRTDSRVLLYAAITAVVVSILFGLAPALQAARTSFVHVLKQTGTSTTTAGSARALSTLVIGQMAVSTALLAGAVLLARTYVNAEGADPGIDARNVLAVDIDLDQAGYDAASSMRFYDRVLQRVGSMPGIEAATLTSETPLAPRPSAGAVTVELPDGKRSADSKMVSDGYFSVLRVPLLQGRNFAAGDRGAAIVNETMAQQFWPGRSAMGQTFRTAGTLVEVIGVAKDIKYRSLIEVPRTVFYRPLEKHIPRISLLVRSPDAAGLVDPIRRAIQAENADLALVDVRSMESIVEGAIAPRRQSARILGLVCGLGLFLSAAGLYGVIAFGVRERSREFGLRMALGARPLDVAKMVLRRGLRLALVGFVIGLVASFWLMRLLARMISGVGSQDPATVAVVCAVLLLVALAASYLPARWATRIDPAVALRGD